MSVTLAPGTRLVFISGQVASDAAGEVVAPDDAAAQAEFVFQRMAAVLAEAGGSLADLVNVTIYLTDIREFPQVSEVRNRRLGDARPASTLVEVSRLAVPGHRVEISGMAVLSGELQE
jgi:enamine deaminase RidA (YjgF/YER057c/UK114 family)